MDACARRAVQVGEGILAMFGRLALHQLGERDELRLRQMARRPLLVV